MKATRTRPCQVEGCDRLGSNRGWCDEHHDVRFMRYVIKAPSGHWIWVGARHGGGSGYGLFNLGRPQTAHRAAWQLFRGPIPEGYHVDHLCRLRICVNPLHLEPVTQRVNNLRGWSVMAHNAEKTHCVNGHPFDEANTLRWGAGRRCRTCYYAWTAARRERRRAAL